MDSHLRAGAAVLDITPETPHFLHGYPFVDRVSTGTHDQLLASALYVDDGNVEVIFISVDLLYVSKELVASIRSGVSLRTGIPYSNILIAATHTHSGPVTVNCLVSTDDPVVPKADEEYLKWLEERCISVADRAVQEVVDVEMGFALADVTGIGTNRHDPAGSKDLDAPVFSFRDMDGRYVALMLVCNMHPTVLHEDSTLYTADFPGYARRFLQQEHLKGNCPVIYFTGTAGNQTPRHVTSSNTFDEAERLGKIVASSVGHVLDAVRYSSQIDIKSSSRLVELPRKEFPSIDEAMTHRDAALHLYDQLKQEGTDSRAIRSAEVDWFGSEEIVVLAKAAQSGSLEETYSTVLPAEIQVISLGQWTLVAWPGEIFVEYGLELKRKVKDAFLITLANGDLQGYVSTEEAREKGYYEASNSLFDYRGGEALLRTSVDMLKEMM